MSYGHNGVLSDECMVHLSAQYQNALCLDKTKLPISLKKKHIYNARLNDHLTFLGVSVKWQKLFGDAVSLSNSGN
jgi:hypothetical protein